LESQSILNPDGREESNYASDTEKEKGSAMSFFSKILDKLGFNRGSERVTTSQTASETQGSPVGLGSTATATASRPAAITVVDVVGKLEQLAASQSQKLDWKTSIVDLLKLLGLDSSFAARKELAVELGIPSEKMKDSAQMNMWLHKTVLQKLADNGGNIPKELLD
jgi:hypothetical protein